MPKILIYSIDHLFSHLLSVSWLERPSGVFCFSQAHLWAFHSSALGPLAEDLTPAAGAELAARAVPHVTVVPHGTPVQAAPLGGGAFVAALTGALHFSLTLRGETTRLGVRVYYYFGFFLNAQMKMMKEREAERDGEDLKELLRLLLLFVCVCVCVCRGR